MTFPHSLGPKLPYDIVLNIIEILLAECLDSPECISVLWTFSLVSQSFVPFCQKKLFRRYNMGRKDAKKCFSILQQSPHLIPYVEEVWIYLGEKGVVNVSVTEMELLRVLTSLRHLSVVGQTTATIRQITWSLVSLSVRRAIASLLVPRRITSFAIVGVEALPDGLIPMWRHLKSLSVWDEDPDAVLYRDSDSQPNSDEVDGEGTYTQFGDPSFHFLPWDTAEDSVVVRLESLSLINSDNILLYILDDTSTADLESPYTAPAHGSPDPDRAQGLAISHADHTFRADSGVQPPGPTFFDFSQLRSFTIDIIESNLLPVFAVIHHARNTLATLDIRQRYLHNVQQDPFGFDSSLNTPPEPLPDKVSLERLVQLQHLSVILLVLPYMPIHLHTLSSWCSLLRTAPRNLRTLEITLDAFYFYYVADLLQWFPDLDDDDDDAANTPLSALDELLANPDAFPCLEYLRLLVRLPEDDDLRGAEPEMTYDVVDDEDIPRLQWWLDKYSNPPPSPPGPDMTVDVVTDEDVEMYAAMGDDYAPDHSDSDRTDSEYVATEPSFSDASAEERAQPVLPFEQVQKSVARMLRLTAARFRETGAAFVVDVEFGAHVGKVQDWGYPVGRKVRPEFLL